MKLFYLVLFVCFTGCQPQKDQALLEWTKQSWEIDVRVNHGMPYIGNGPSSVIYDGDSPELYSGTSPKIAAKNIELKTPKYKIIGAITDLHETLPGRFGFRAKEGEHIGYIIMSLNYDQKSGTAFWGYRFYPLDFFREMDRQSKEKEPNQPLQRTSTAVTDRAAHAPRQLLRSLT